MMVALSLYPKQLKASYLRGASSIASHQHITHNLTAVLKLPLNRRSAFFDPTLDLWVIWILISFFERLFNCETL